MGDEFPPIVVLTGLTASGKTALSIALARALGAEIISMDSGLVYRGLDIGTAKPSAEERCGVPHHLIDVRDPWETYSAASFVEDTVRIVAELRARGKRALIVGGTLLYLRALEQGLAPLPPADPAVRASLAAEAETRGWQALHTELASVDPLVASRIHPNDPQRVQRALEVYRLTGRALGDWQRETKPPFDEKLLKLALIPTSRDWLHERIRRRLDTMVVEGFLDEVRALLADSRVAMTQPALRSVGYRQAAEHILGIERPSSDGRDWLSRARAATRQLAKRQHTWLRGMSELHVLPCDTLSGEKTLAMAMARTKLLTGTQLPAP